MQIMKKSFVQMFCTKNSKRKYKLYLAVMSKWVCNQTCHSL